MKAHLVAPLMGLVRYVVIHPGAHLDEWYGVYLLKKYGKILFPGIDTALVIDRLTPEMMDELPDLEPETLRQHGYLSVGTLGGWFDEHQSDSAMRSDKECAASLVFRALNLPDDIAKLHTRLMNFVKHTDLNGHDAAQKVLKGAARGYVDFCPQFILRKLNSAGESLEKIWEFMEMQIDAEVFSQQQYFEARDLAKFAKRLDGKFCLINSDNPTIAGALRGSGAELVIVRKSTGHVLITTKGKTIDTRALLRGIRSLEMAKRGLQLEIGGIEDENWNFSLIPWYFHEPEGNILNTPDKSPVPVEATILTDVEFVELVRTHVRF